MARLGLETHLVDGEVYQANAGPLPRGRGRPADLRRIEGPLDDPAGDRQAPRRHRPRFAPSAEPLSRPLVQRRFAPRSRGRARRDRTAVRADGLAGAHRARARRPLPDDPRPQGSRRLRLPRAARRHRPVRPDAPPRDLALDRQLLSRRRRHLANSRQPRRRGAAGEHEPGALRLARSLGRRPLRHRPHARLGKQRQGDLRRLRRARTRSGQYRLQSVLRVRQLRRPPLVHRRRFGARLPRACRRSAARPARRLRLGHRLGGHDCGGRPPQSDARRKDRGGRGGRMPDIALQRLRRAQHPGHRRQARAADPQRHEHRRRHRRSAIARPTRC